MFFYTRLLLGQNLSVRMVCLKKNVEKTFLFTPFLDQGGHPATTFNAGFRLIGTRKHLFCFFEFLKSEELGTWIQCTDFFSTINLR